MKKQSILILSITLLAAVVVTPSVSAQSNKKWAVETNVVWPFVPGINITQVKVAPLLWQTERQQGELILGAMYRNTSEDENADIHREIGATLGYRHFWVKGFHTELVVHITYAEEIRNKADDLNYRGLALTPEVYTGYRFDFSRNRRVSLYLTPQLGFGKNVYADLGPETEKSKAFPVLSLLAGVRF